MSTPIRISLALALVAGAGSLAFFASSPGAQTSATGAQAASSPVVATIDGDPITASDLDRSIGAELGRLEQQIFDLRRQRLDQLIANRLLEREAARRNVTVDALIKTEITDKVAPVGDEQVTRFYEANKARLPNAPNIKDQIKRYLESQEAEDKRESYVDGLRTAAKVSVSLAAPPVRRADVSVGTSPIRGDANAPITIVEFSDFHCPFCRTVQPTLLQVLDRYPGKVRLVYKDLPLDGLHPNARKVSEAARCANEQGKFWPFHDAAYAGTVGTDVSPTAMDTLATKAQLDIPAFKQCLDSGRHQAGILSDLAEAQRLGLSGTPAFFINGRLITGAQPLDGFVKIIEEELASK